MGVFSWVSTHWLEILQSTSIVAGLLFTGYNIRADSRQRKIQSLFALTAAHRDIWSKLYEHPNLANILMPEAEALLASNSEELFVQMLILHLAASYRARKFGMYFEEEGLRMDVKQFFSLPIPKAVWKKSKEFQDSDFMAFVESCM